MVALRVIGGLMVLYGVVMLVLLATPAQDWALDHSIAELVSYTDRRANNQVSGSVDMPLAIVGSAVVIFAGLWIGLLVPRVLQRQQQAMLEGFEDADGPA